MLEKQETYSIKVQDFEGPFDLLLFFIEREELSIYDVSISKITEDFLHYIQQMLELDIHLSSEFIFMASKLMKIKAHSLLPGKEKDEDDEELTEEELVQKIIEYKKYKQIGAFLGTLEENKFLAQSRGNEGDEIEYYFKQRNQTADSYSLPNMYNLFLIHRGLERHLKKDKIDNYSIEPLPYTVEEQREIIMDLININKKLKCFDIIKKSENRLQFVVNFLAILDLLQEKILKIQVLPGYNNFVLRFF